MSQIQLQGDGDAAVDHAVPTVWQSRVVRWFGHILAEDAELLARWRARLTAVLLLAAATLGVIPASMTIVVMVGQGEWPLVLLDTGLLAIVFVLLCSKRATNRWRNIFLTSAAWLMGVTFILSLGPFSTALGWMFMSVFMAAFLLDTRATVFVVTTILLVLGGVAAGISNDMMHWALGDETALSRWTLTAVDFAFLISLFAASNRFIMRLLEREDAARVIAEQQLAEGRRNEALGTLAGGIAHDFNNLLVPVLANIEMVQDTLPEHSAERTALQDAQRSAERARDLVQRILSFGRGADANRSVLDLANVAADVIRMTRSTLPPHVSLMLEQHNVAPVLASAAEVHQIVSNLVTNAVHAVTEQGLVIVDISSINKNGKPWVRLSVQDTGVGMDAATRERIFDPYFSTREVGRGTGLGLPIVQSLVSSLGGSIDVRSAVRQGSSFTVLLPKAIMADVAAPETLQLPSPEVNSSIEMPATQRSVRSPVIDPALNSAQFTTPQTGSRATRVLLVDDEFTVQKVTARLLSMLGCHVEVANNTTEALTLLSASTEAFDLLVTDYRMPGRSGSELIAAALELHPTLRVVLASGHIESATVTGSLSDRVVLLRKPFSRAELTDAVNEALTEAQPIRPFIHAATRPD